MNTEFAGWIETFTGRAVSPFAPDPSEIDVRDIAHALSLVCRFTGHVRRFYSVAEHSVRASRAAEHYVLDWGRPEVALLGVLLHDASEAYLCDVAAPVKHSPPMLHYRSAERHLQRVIFQRFRVGCHDRDYFVDAVRHVDMRMLFTERRDLMPATGRVWVGEDEYAPFPEKIEPWAPERAEMEFLQRFQELTALVNVCEQPRCVRAAGDDGWCDTHRPPALEERTRDDHEAHGAKPF
jgi:5'-deoxynucleotidase YfbR-like HD superfamily hydrolase